MSSLLTLRAMTEYRTAVSHLRNPDASSSPWLSPPRIITGAGTDPIAFNAQAPPASRGLGGRIGRMFSKHASESDLVASAAATPNPHIRVVAVGAESTFGHVPKNLSVSRAHFFIPGCAVLIPLLLAVTSAFIPECLFKSRYSVPNCRGCYLISATLCPLAFDIQENEARECVPASLAVVPLKLIVDVLSQLSLSLRCFSVCF